MSKLCRDQICFCKLCSPRKSRRVCHMMFVGWGNCILATRLYAFIITDYFLLLYDESININQLTSTAESAHGVSWCAEIGRPTHAFVASQHHPFRSLFADFRRFSPLKAQGSRLKAHINFFSLKFTQNESNFKMLLLIEFESNKNSYQYD